MTIEQFPSDLRGRFPLSAINVELSVIPAYVVEAILNFVHFAILGSLAQVLSRHRFKVLKYSAAHEIRIRSTGVVLEIVLERDGETLLQQWDSSRVTRCQER